MTDKEKFRKEVEKLKSNLMYGACSSQIAMETYCKEEAYNEVLAILDTVQEEPVSEKKCMYTKDSYTNEDRKVLCEDCKEKCEYNKKEEPSSEELGEYINKLSKQFPEVSFAKLSRIAVRVAKWQKQHLWKSADGENLPEYDREVIAITDYDFGHYKVVYAHRPNPDGWNGTNIDTGEKEHFEPVIYDKGGWNQPHILYWLDTRLPYEENKIIK